MHELDFNEVSTAWAGVVAKVGVLRVPTSEAEHLRLVDLLDAVLDATREIAEHPLGGLIDLLGDLIEVYESRTLGEASAPPAEILRLLMDSNGLRQADLAEELGGQSVVSAILSGARDINARQAGALASRFGVSPAIFIPVSRPSASQKPAPAAAQPKVTYVRRRAYTRPSMTFFKDVVLSLNVPKAATQRQSSPHQTLKLDLKEEVACQ